MIIVGIFNNSTSFVYFWTCHQLTIKIFDYVNMVVVSSKRWLGSFQEFLVINLLVFPFLKLASQRHFGVFFHPKTNSKWLLYFGGWNVTNDNSLMLIHNWHIVDTWHSYPGITKFWSIVLCNCKWQCPDSFYCSNCWGDWHFSLHGNFPNLWNKS
jgi:hypothetical protein